MKKPNIAKFIRNRWLNTLNLKRLHQYVLLSVLWPVLVVGALFGALTSIVFTGQKQMQLAYLAEDKLLEMALINTAGFEPWQELDSGNSTTQRPTRALIIDISERDFANYGSVKSNNIKQTLGLSLPVLGKLLSRAAAIGVKAVYVDLTPSLYDETKASDVDDFIKLIHELASKVNLRFAFDMPKSAAASAPWLKELPAFDPGLCREGNTVQTRCSFNPEWDDWVIQSLYLDAGNVNDPNFEAPWISFNLASSYPSYILNLPNKDMMPRFDATQFIEQNFIESLAQRPTVVFVGPTPASKFDRNDGISGLRPAVVTPSDAAAGGIKGSFETTRHVFWAQVLTMFAQQRMVRIPPPAIKNVVTLFFCGLMVAAVLLLHGWMAFAIYTVFVCGGPFANALAIRYGMLYVPFFDSYYFGFATLIVTSFGQLSYGSFLRWRSEEKRRLLTQTSDLKSNFISLLSHNLNTPIAKMQGTLALLTSQPAQGDWKNSITQAEVYVAQLELGVRTVLIGSAVEENALHSRAVSAQALTEEIRSQCQGVLRRLGLGVTIDAPQGDEDILALPLRFDTRALCAAVSAAAGLFALNQQGQSQGHGQKARIRVGLVVTNDDSPDRGPALILKIDAEQAWLPGAAVAALRSQSQSSIRRRETGDFLTDVLSELVLQVCAKYQGFVELTPKGSGGFIMIAMRPDEG